MQPLQKEKKMEKEVKKDLNNNELSVLAGLCDDFIMEADAEDLNCFPRLGYADTAFDNAVRCTHLSMNSVKGYITQLVQKGYIEIEEIDGDKYITLLEKCGDVIEYKGNYNYGAK